jgi:hypothetical protein
MAFALLQIKGLTYPASKEVVENAMQVICGQPKVVLKTLVDLSNLRSIMSSSFAYRLNKSTSEDFSFATFLYTLHDNGNCPWKEDIEVATLKSLSMSNLE